MVVTIDGFASSGKSTCGRLLSRELGWNLLRTGMAHRANVWLILARGVDIHDAVAMAAHMSELDFQVDIVDGELVVLLAGASPGEAALHAPAVRELLPRVTRVPEVCRGLALIFRSAVAGRRVVAEGHGLGTGIFPEARLKFFCDAPLEVRAARRHRQEQRAGSVRSLKEVRAEVERRDRSDAERPVNPVARMPDMVVLDTWRQAPRQCVETAIGTLRAAAIIDRRADGPAPGA